MIVEAGRPHSHRRNRGSIFMNLAYPYYELILALTTVEFFPILA